MYQGMSIQIVPAPENHPEWGKIVLRPQQNGEVMKCDQCLGTGKLPKGDSCHKCGGQGTAPFVSALRLFVEPGKVNGLDEAQIHEVRQFVKDLSPWYRQDRTVLLQERGGGSTNTGQSQIVCGLVGSPLPAFGGRRHCNAVHAEFWVHAALVIRYLHHRGDGSGSVYLVGIDRKAPQHIGVYCEEVYRVEDEIQIENEKIARTIPFPYRAWKRAKEKSHCYHCRSAFYVASGGASGPDGALTGAAAAYGGLPSPFKGPGIGYDPSN